MTNYREFLEVAERAATAAAVIAKDGFQSSHSRDWKPDSSPVTEYDRAAEEAAKQIIGQAFPDHAILAEESGASGSHRYQWVIDPIDGTRNYTFGIPLYATAVVLTENSQPVVAVVIAPSLGQTFLAAKGEGATLNGEGLALPAPLPLAQSLVGFTGERKAAEAYHEARNRLRGKIGSPRMLGSAILQLCWVASGQLHAVVAHHSKPWDLYAGVLVATEAGATALTYDGNPWQPGRPDLVLASEPIGREVIHAIA